MMQPVLVRLTEDDKFHLEEEAQRQRQSVSEILRRAVKSYLNKRPKQKDGAKIMLEWMNKPKIAIKTDLTSKNYKQQLYSLPSKD